jgi:hypothetical protein
MSEHLRDRLPRRGPGRPKGSPNKLPASVKEAILKAGEAAGGDDGLVGYLRKQAIENPGPFLSLLGKVLPLQVGGEGGGPIVLKMRWMRDDEPDTDA